MDTSETPLAPWRLVMSLVAALSGVVLSYHFKLDIERKLVVALCRAIVQLLLLGYLLLSFIFSSESPVIVMIYLSLMILIAATEVINRQVRTYHGHYVDALMACLIGGGLTGVYASAIVFNPTPWWNPRVFIPTAGMIIGNSVSGPSVAVDRLLSDVTEKKHETEVRLAFGATSYEALLAPLRAAVLAAMMPILNMLSIVGVVSIPGMMTGQLLGGSTPLVAAEYQMAILFLLAATTTISTYLSVVLAIKHAVMSPEQRLTPERIVPKTGPKVSIDVAIWLGAKDAGSNLLKCLQQRCCILAYCAPLCGEATSRSPVSSARVRYNPLPASAIELTDIHPSSAVLHTNNGVMRRDGGGTNGGRGGGELDHAEEAAFRACYEIRANGPFPTGTAAILQFEGMNIESGDLMLFGADGITFSVHRGQRVTLEGSSGLGKTRLLRAMAQLDDFMSGTATLHVTASGVVGGGDNGANTGSSVTLLGAANRAAEGVQAKKYAAQVYAQWRSRVMYIPQALPPLVGTPVELLVEVLAYKSRKETGKSKECQLVEVTAACEKMESQLLLGAGKMSQQWGALSGGERQRAVIACGLILCHWDAPLSSVESTKKLSPSRSSTQPSGSESERAFATVAEEVVAGTAGPGCVLLLDEPTAACDEAACAAVERALVQSGVACVIVTHDQRQAERLAHTRILLS